MSERIKLAQKAISDSPRSFGGLKLTARPSPYDERDYKYHILAQYLPKTGVTGDKQKTGYRANLPPVWNQGKLGTCTCASFCWGPKAFEEISQGDFPANGLSMAYLYSRAYQINGTPGEAGLYQRSVMKVAQQYGVCTEDRLPYSWLMTDVNPPAPPPECDQEAAQYKIQTFAQVCSPTDDDLEARIDLLRHAIINSGPLIVDFIVTENFMSPQPPNYIAPYPEGRILGGHGICCCDIDDWREVFVWRNTWGEEWGDKGYIYIPYDWVTKTFSPDDVHQVPFLLEAWTAVDLVVPRPAGKIVMKVGGRTALVDGTLILIDQPPVVDPKTNRTLAPVRFLANNLGFLVQWDGRIGKIILQRPDGSLTIILAINQPAAMVNGKAVQLDQPPVIDEGTNRALLPARFLAETAGYGVVWDDASQTVTLTKKV